MSVKDLYCLAYAPVQGTCLLDLEKDDICPELLTKELKFLEKFTATSFQGFTRYFEKADLSTSEAAAALFCLSTFCNRLQTLSLRAGTLAGELLQQGSADYRDTLKQITAEAKSNGLPPEDKRIEDLFDTEKDAEWEVPAPSKGKVDFRHSVSMISQKDGNGTGTETVHKPVKPEFTRKKVRKATGYAKFNFSAEDVQDANKSDESECPSEPPQRVHSATPSEHNEPSSRKNSTTPTKEAAESDGLPLLCFCCRAESPADMTNELVRRPSFVSMGSVQEIQDKDADVHWHDSERHSGRFTRIRGRIPTGHVSVMKSNSEEMLDKLLSEDTEEGRRARELLIHNTELNSASPPLSPCSSSSDVPGSSAALHKGLWGSDKEDLTSPVHAEDLFGGSL